MNFHTRRHQEVGLQNGSRYHMRGIKVKSSPLGEATVIQMMPFLLSLPLSPPDFLPHNPALAWTQYMRKWEPPSPLGHVWLVWKANSKIWNTMVVVGACTSAILIGHALPSHCMMSRWFATCSIQLACRWVIPKYQGQVSFRCLLVSWRGKGMCRYTPPNWAEAQAMHASTLGMRRLLKLPASPCWKVRGFTMLWKVFLAHMAARYMWLFSPKVKWSCHLSATLPPCQICGQCLPAFTRSWERQEKMQLPNMSTGLALERGLKFWLWSVRFLLSRWRKNPKPRTMDQTELRKIRMIKLIRSIITLSFITNYLLFLSNHPNLLVIGYPLGWPSSSHQADMKKQIGSELPT